MSGTSIAAVDVITAPGTLAAKASMVLFIDAANFRLVSIDQTAVAFGFRPEPDPNDLSSGIVMESTRFEFTVSTTMEFEYFEQPISIERPEL